jgi:hypothetical protein
MPPKSDLRINFLSYSLITVAIPFVGLFQSPSLFHILFPFPVNSPEEVVPIALSSIQIGPSSGMKKRGFRVPFEGKAISYAVPLYPGV